jgi:adenylate cyclase, class 2
LTGPVETEIKLETPSPEAARAAVARLGARLKSPRHFEDNLLLDDAAGSLRAAGTILRLRRVPEGGVLTYKGPRLDSAGLKSRPERETTVGDAGAMQDILARIGLRPVFRYQKYREAYDWRGQEIVVDETPIGTYLEVEGDAEGIHAAAAAMGFGPADYVTDSYVGLFLAAGGKGDMVFP